MRTCGHAASQYGGTALVLAASGGHKDVVELLLDRGADLEAKNTVKFAEAALLGILGRAGDLRQGLQWAIASKARALAQMARCS